MHTTEGMLMGRLNRHMRTWPGARVAVLRASLPRLAPKRSGIRPAPARPDDRDLLEDALSPQIVGLCAVLLVVFVSLAMFADRSATAAIASQAHPQWQAVAPAADADTRSGAPKRKFTRAR
jgi:hypothetical protein